MKKRSLPKPTEAELSILRVLWQHGPSTVRQVYERLKSQPPGRYTTVLKLMQIMVEKGLVIRDDSERSHVYQATLAEEETQRQLVGHLLERAFFGSAPKLVLQALSAKRATPEDLAEIRRLLDQIEKGNS
jgi:predicted transcriptional regulator